MLEDFNGYQVKNVSALGDGWYEIDFYTKVFVTNRLFTLDYCTGIFWLEN